MRVFRCKACRRKTKLGHFRCDACGAPAGAQNWAVPAAVAVVVLYVIYAVLL